MEPNQNSDRGPHGRVVEMLPDTKSFAIVPTADRRHPVKTAANIDAAPEAAVDSSAAPESTSHIRLE